MKSSHSRTFLGALAALIMTPLLSHAQVLGVNFEATANGFDGFNFNVGVDPTKVAGVVPQLNFNNEVAPFPSGGIDTTVSGSSLVYADGTAATDLTLEYSAPQGFATTYSVTGNTSALFSGYLDSTSSGGDYFSVDGLSSGTHTLELYISGDQNDSDNGGTYNINGTSYNLTNDGGVSAASNNFTLAIPGGTGGAGAVAGNYFTTTFTGTSLTVLATDAYGPVPRTPIDGFQIITDVPEPSTWAMMLGGLGILFVIIRLRSASSI